LTTTVWTEDEAKAAIRKYDFYIDRANKVGAETEEAKKSLLEAVNAFDAGNMNYVFSRIVETKAHLTASIRDIGSDTNSGGDRNTGGKEPRWLEAWLRRLKADWQKEDYFWFLYGYYPLLAATLFFLLYASLLTLWPILGQIKVPLPILGPIKPHAFGVPVWAVLFAGIGACVQIMIDITNDLKKSGYVEKYAKIWYMFLPIVGPVFGFLAYVLLSLGFLSLSGITAEQLGKATFSVIVVCFLAGYSTEWFMRQLGKLSG
jgi:hypothetical protein